MGTVKTCEAMINVWSRFGTKRSFKNAVIKSVSRILEIRFYIKILYFYNDN